MKRILITGFEPFSDFPSNPSEVLVRSLSDWFKASSKHQVKTLVLPVDYEKVDRWFLETDFSDFDFVFQFGVAAQRYKVCLERVALNWVESKIADNSGIIKQGQSIQPDLPEAFFSRLHLSQIVSEVAPQFENNLEVSFTAGAYLCNYTYFKTREKTEKSLFIHIPSQIKIDGDFQNYTEARYKSTIQEICLAVIKKILDGSPDIKPVK